MQIDWLYALKKRILVGVLGILTLSLVATMVFLALFLRNRLIDDSRIKTQELGNAVKSSVSSLMIARNPAMIQNIMENIRKSNGSLVKAFVLDRNGRIAYSSDKREIGKVLDRNHDTTCNGCHQKTGESPPERTIMIESGGMKMQRNVKVLYNEEACYGCHAKSERINGKLIIDRSLKQTYSLIASIELIIFGSGLVCLVFLVTFLTMFFSRGINRYIDKIVRQNHELTVLYHMMERLSRTIDLEELKAIVIEIVGDTFGADEVDIVLARENKEFSCVTWNRRENKRTRKKIAEDSSMFSAVKDWLGGSLTGVKIAEDKRHVIIPLSKGNTRLALIDIRRDEAFDSRGLDLVKAVSSHLAIAFENAFLHYVAITDELTKLYTQRHFRHSIEKQFEDFEQYGEKFALLMIDIDDFKAINDTYGHPAGDSVLRGVARHIMRSIRDGDMAFRYGGEEFTAILPFTNAAGGKHVAERIRQAIEAARFEKEAGDLKVTISIGVSLCPDNARTISDLKITADKALYQAKAAGKNRVVVSDEKPKG